MRLRQHRSVIAIVIAVAILLLLLGVALAADTVTAVPCTRDGPTGKVLQIEASIRLPAEEFKTLLEFDDLMVAYKWLTVNGHVSKITFRAGCPEATMND